MGHIRPHTPTRRQRQIGSFLPYSGMVGGMNLPAGCRLNMVTKE
jgi:hypothetical protein